MSDDQKINRRSLLKMMATLAPAGTLAGVANKMSVKAEEVVIDVAEPGADETVITTGHVDDLYHNVYFLAPGKTWADIPEFKATGFDERED